LSVTTYVNFPSSAHVWVPLTSNPFGVEAIVPPLEVPSPQSIVAVQLVGEQNAVENDATVPLN
jgi:hypothetical protein